MITTTTDTAGGTAASGRATADRLRRDYEWLHRHPELSMAEHQTSAYIERRLQELGAETLRCAGTGLVAILRNGEGPVAALRADLDALPITEETGLPYASSANGRAPAMHACGHDAHTAMALAAARTLAGQRGDWHGTAVFIFQPGEETAQGAAAMVADGLWDRTPVPEVLFAQHITAGEAGVIELAEGPAFSMADSWKVLIRGVQAHAAQPHLSIDAIVLAAHIIVRLQSIVSREVPPLESVVITVGTINAGQKENIIPASAEITLNVRTFIPAVREQVLTSIRRVIEGEALASGAPQPEITELYRFPATINDPIRADRLAARFRQDLGEHRVRRTGPATPSEDVGNLTAPAGIPLVYWRIGSTSPARLQQGPVPANHSPRFAPDPEPTLEAGHEAALSALLSVLRHA